MEILGLSLDEALQLWLMILLTVLGGAALAVAYAAVRRSPRPAGGQDSTQRRGGGEAETRPSGPRPRRTPPILAAPPEGLARELDGAVAGELWRRVKSAVEDGLVHVRLVAPGCGGYVAVDLAGELLCVEGDRVRPLAGKPAPVVEVEEEGGE